MTGTALRAWTAAQPATAAAPGEARLLLSVVVPVRDEAENIAPLIAEIDRALAAHSPFEVIYVDDGSADDTPRRLAEATLLYPWLRVLRHRQSCGQSAALTTGIRAARAEWIATLDGDGQNDPADIAVLLRALGDGAAADAPALVAGLRRRRRDGIGKRVASRIANFIRSRLLRDDTPDTGCGLKLFRRSAFLALPNFDHMHRFLPALFRRNGGRVRLVEVGHRPRTSGLSKYGNLQRALVGSVDLFGVMWLQRRSRLPVVEGDGEAPSSFSNTGD
ncbi:MAG: glycosyltransferase family 2 protein [Rhodospirillaceae bacterium]|nr:glycosyltransferase family 2 protein [Rhodospirillaceae bacterium]